MECELVNMFNAAFLGKGTFDFYETIYTKNTRDILSEKLEFIDELITYDNFKQYSEQLKSSEYIFSSWGMPCFTEQEIEEYFPALKAVFYAAGSGQHFARPFLNKGIKVFSAWAANAVPVAEYAVAQIILANKGFYQAVNKFNDYGRKIAGDYCNTFTGNYGTKIGIIGAGMIGKEVIKLLKPYRLDVLVFDPFLSQGKANELEVTLSSLEDIFTQCTVISNHLANNQQTKKMLNYNLFSLMKDNATFINTGRGAQVVEDDLVRALKEKENRTALLDVTEPEPPIQGHDFYKMQNVFLTPHIAGSMKDEVARMGEYMCNEFIALIDGDMTKYEVTLNMLETMA